MGEAEQQLQQAEQRLAERELTAALACFDAAEHSGADPDRCSAGRWMAHMLQGNCDGAWNESDAIRTRGTPDPQRFWNGACIDGKRVVVRCLHGFGDSVQFLRYVPLLRQRASHVLVELPPKMLEIARAFEGVDEVITWGEQSPAWDIQMEVTELPYYFRTELRDLPIASNYLHLSRIGNRCARRVFSEAHKLRVGVVWSSGEWNLSRSIRLHELEPLFRLADLEFWNLQGGVVRKEWNTLPRQANLCDAPAYCADTGILSLARFIAEMDLVITVDTLAAHLGGALGRPTWVLLQECADWRWMVDREDSPWYPSLRLFRQRKQGEWGAVIAQVSGDLALWSAKQDRREAVA